MARIHLQMSGAIKSTSNRESKFLSLKPKLRWFRSYLNKWVTWTHAYIDIKIRLDPISVIKPRDVRAQPWLVAANLLVVFAINGCGNRPLLISSYNAQVPAVATLSSQYQYQHIEGISATIAWRGSEKNGDEEANRIFAIPDPSSLFGHQLISPTSAGTGPVQLVRAGDRYFLGWIDKTEETAALLRWQILSASDLSVIDSGEWRANENGEDFLVSDFAAAYHPDEEIVLVALLKHTPTTEGFQECIHEEGRIGCSLVILPIHVGDTQVQEIAVTPEATTITDNSEYVYDVSVSAGSNGFLVAYIRGFRGYYHTMGNFVNVLPLDVTGTTLRSGFLITGKSDCADDPQRLIDEEDYLITGNPFDSSLSNFTGTAVAYDPNYVDDDQNKGRYLVGYTTACGDSGYYRGRFVTKVENGWTVSGVVEDAYTSGGGSDKRVLEPPISIAESTHSPVTKPMLAYNESINSFIAAFGSRQNIQTLSRQMLYTRFLDEHGNPMSSSNPVLEDKYNSGWGDIYSTFVTGSIVSDPELEKNYLVWEQKNKQVPCLEREDWSYSCRLDWSGVTTNRKSEVYFKSFD